MNKIAKWGTGIATGFSLLYWGALPALALDLCPKNITNQELCNVRGPEAIIQGVLNLLLFVAFIAALIFLVIGGIRWILSGGDKEATGKAKGTVTAALIGLVIVLASWLLINLVLQFFGIGGVNGVNLFDIFGNPINTSGGSGTHVK